MIFPTQFSSADDAVRTALRASDEIAEARRRREDAEARLADAEKGYTMAVDALVAYGSATYLYGSKIVTVNRPSGNQIASVTVTEPRLVKSGP